MALTKREKWVYEYMEKMLQKSNVDYEWLSPTEVGSAYGKSCLNPNGNYHSSTGSPILKSLVSKGYAERNKNGYYRIIINPSVTV